ncbi:MAG: hypothetical protein VYB10_01360 [Actinomycetota bacterium]|nr:hypothetical protein [Actinomycetota bacterium]
MKTHYGGLQPCCSPNTHEGANILLRLDEFPKFSEALSEEFNVG